MFALVDTASGGDYCLPTGGEEPRHRRDDAMTANTITTTATLPFTGRTAIEAAQATTGLRICKHGDPTEGAREGLTAAEALAIVAEDPELIYVTADLEWRGAHEESVAVVGALSILVQTPDARGAAATVHVGDLDGDWTPIRPDHEVVEAAEAALVEYLETVIA